MAYNLTTEVVNNPTEKLVFVTPEVEETFPNSVQTFDSINDSYESNTAAHLKKLEDSLFSFKSSTGANIDCSLIPGKGSELLVMWSPFSDGSPNSDAATMLKYISGENTSKVKAAPNSWSQTTKSGVISELLKASGREMPVLTIFSPLPSFPHNAYSHDDYKKIRQGDFTPAERITTEAIMYVQDRLHGSKSETQLDQLHLHGASLGASSAIGAANGLIIASKYAVRSLTAQELIIAPKNVIPDLGTLFTIKNTVGEPSTLSPDKSWGVIKEPLIRQQIDAHGNEPMMVGRMLQGMSKLSRLKGLTRPEGNVTPQLIENIVAADVSVSIPLAVNSGLTIDTPKYLPNSGEHVVLVRATENDRTAHLLDEHVGLVALLAVTNIRNN